MAHQVVLIVDDERNIIKALFRLLRSPERQLLAAQSGEEAVVTLASEHVDVVISDEKMPGMSGMTVLDRARSLAPEAKRILLTGFPDAEIVREALRKRIAHHVVLKPWVDEELRRKLEAAISGG